MKGIIRYCVDHSLFVHLFSVFLFVAGILCFAATRREAFLNVSDIDEMKNISMLIIKFGSVILTSITTVADLMPFNCELGGNDQFLKPMALAVSWELLLAAVFMLLLSPCSYVISDDLTGFLKNLFHRKKSTPTSISSL